MSKILVCMTIQENSKRLIYEGFQLSQKLQGELHILHIQKGDSIFSAPEHPALFEELFSYASEVGGQVHFLSSSDVPTTIHQFIKDTSISHLVVGRPNASLSHSPAIYKKITEVIKNVELLSLDRED